MRTAVVFRKYLHYLWENSSPAKIANILTNMAEAKAGVAHLRSMPWKLTIDPGNFCNLRCPGCHTGIRHPEMVKPCFMGLDQYQRYLSPFEKHVLSVALYNWGEPFLNKQIFDIIDHTTRRGMGSTIHSNFNHFSEQMAVDAVKSGLTHIYLSIDGATQDTYSQYRVKGKISRVLENLSLMLETRNRMNSAYPLITWKFLEFDHNRHELETARQMAADIGVDDFEVFTGSPHLCDIYTISEHALADPASLSSVKACRSLWNSTYIGSDGSVFPCSLAFRPDEAFGNLQHEDFRSVWNNESYVNARNMRKGAAVPLPCAGCVHYLACHARLN